MPALERVVENAANESQAADLLSKLLKIPSYQTEFYESDPMIQNFIRNVIRPDLKDGGVKDIILDKGGNLIAEIKSKTNNSGKSLMFLAYAMTAAPGSMKDAFSGKIVDGKGFGLRGRGILGRGACEQKATLTAMMLAFKALASSGENCPGDVIFVVSTAGETGRHDSLRQIVEQDGIKSDYAIQSGEPEIQLGNNGRLDVIITVQGRACHSSVPWEGINAIDGMFSVYGNMGKLMPYPSEKAHPQLGKATLTPIYVESFPRATHTVQSKCVLRLDRRLLPGEDPVQALSQISAAVGRGEKYGINVEAGPFMYPSEVPSGSAISRSLSNAIRTVLGSSPKFAYSHQALDAGYLNVKGIETVCYGSGQYRFAHTDVDIASIEDTVDAAKVMTYLALKGIS